MKKFQLNLKEIKFPEKFKIILALFSFAVTQPLFDVLNKNQEFFVSSRLSTINIIVIAFIIAFIIPIFLYLLYLLFYKVNKRFAKILFIIVSSSLLSLITSYSLIKINSYFDFKIILLFIFLLIILILFLNNSNVKKLLAFFSVSSFIFVGIFLFQNKLIISSLGFVKNLKKESRSLVDLKKDYPIFLIVFDELPLNSLLDENGEIDKVLFPNFASLSENFTWFKNATTVTDSTKKALPAILTGNYPKKDALATLDFYPNNIFTFLAEDYKIYADEIHTSLCPKDLCVLSRNSKKSSIKIIIYDLLTIYFHTVLPENLNSFLPTTGGKWSSFTKIENKSNNGDARDDYFYNFLESIKKTNYPLFYFIHIELPHVPHNFLPSGKLYDNTPPLFEMGKINVNSEFWGDNEWLIKLDYQRHLLQVMFVDNLVGKFITKLNETKMFDQSLIILVSDHGASYIANDHRRGVTDKNFQDILSIPLFVKKPFQKEGEISIRPSETIDIVPTILDCLEVKKNFEFDGISLLTESEKNVKKIFISDPKKEVFVTDESTLQEKRRIFLNTKYTNTQKNKSDYEKVYMIGSFPEIYGKNIENYYFNKSTNTSVSINNEHLYENINHSDYFIPTLINGYVNNNDDIWNNISLAVSINGVIGATTYTTRLEDGRIYWSVLVNEKLFNDGKNIIEVFKVIEENNNLELFKMKNERIENFSLIGEHDLIKIKNNTTNEIFKVKREYGMGFFIDDIDVEKNLLKVSGWAVDLNNNNIAKDIILFIDGKFIQIVRPTVKRNDVVEYFENNQYLYSGYSFTYPVDENFDSKSGIRVFAISEDNIAWELLKLI